jgi:hypothetical protein
MTVGKGNHDRMSGSLRQDGLSGVLISVGGYAPRDGRAFFAGGCGCEPAAEAVAASGDNPPDLHVLNVVVRDVAAGLTVYQRLGSPSPTTASTCGCRCQEGSAWTRTQPNQPGRGTPTGAPTRPAPRWFPGSCSRPAGSSATVTQS